MSEDSSNPFWTSPASVGLRGVALLAMGVVFGLAFNQLRPQSFAFTAWAPPTTCAAVGEEHETAMRPIEVLVPEQVAALCGVPGVAFADVRDKHEFESGHVVQAHHLPCTASPDAAKLTVDVLAATNTVVVYGEATEDAARVADSLREKAARPDLRIIVLSGGFKAWNEAGLACTSGACDACGEAKL